MRHCQKGILIAFAGTVIWASTGIFISYLFTHYTIQPLTLSFWRALIMSVTMIAFFALTDRAALRVTRDDLIFLFFYGAVILTLMNVLWTSSVQFNGASVATVLVYSSPGFTALLARPLLKEPLTWRKIVAVLLSLVGCVLVAKAYTLEVWQTNLLGIVIGVASGVAMAAYSLAGRYSAKRFANGWTVTIYGFTFVAFALAFTQNPDSLFTLGTAWDGWIILAILALGPSIFGFGFYTLSLRYLSASTSSLIASLEPVMTAIMAIFILGESLNIIQWLGAAITVAAVVLVQSGE